MKIFAAILSAALLCSLRPLVAQDANSVPVPDKQVLDPVAQPTPVAPPDGGLMLIPDTPPPVEKPSYRGSGSSSSATRSAAPNPIKKNKTEASIEDFSERIKFREAKTKAMRDEKIQGELAAAAAAKTDQEKREALRRYYKLLYAKILKIDGSLKKIVAQRQDQSLKQLDQGNVRLE